MTEPLAGGAPLDPAELEPIAGAYRLSQMVYALAALGIPDALKAGPRAAGELASAIGADARSLARLLRVAAGRGMLGFDSGRYALTPFAERLTSDAPDSARAMVLGWRVLPTKYDAFGGLTETIRTGRSAFERAHGARFYERLAEMPAEAAAYDAAMNSTVSGFRAAAASIDLGDATTVVDVGGGHGGLLIEVLRRNPWLRGVLFDLPSVAAVGSVLVEGAGLTDRVEVVGGDMFAEMPRGGDAYLFSTVLRCFDDKDCIRLLERTREAMAPGALVHAIEMVPPDEPWASPAGLADLDAMVLYGGADRTAEEWEALLHRAGLELAGITDPADPPFSIVTAGASQSSDGG